MNVRNNDRRHRKPPLFDGARCYCCYCKRQLDPPQPEKWTSLTFDHIRAESQGGTRKVPSCRKCNFLKDDLTPGEWFWFIQAHPRWWKEFSLPSQVKRIVREHHFAEARRA